MKQSLQRRDPLRLRALPEVLKGWIRVWIDGEGEFTFRAGDTWTQPPGIRHDVREFSGDFEVLEIVSPGVFDTHEA